MKKNLSYPPWVSAYTLILEPALYIAHSYDNEVVGCISATTLHFYLLKTIVYYFIYSLQCLHTFSLCSEFERVLIFLLFSICYYFSLLFLKNALLSLLFILICHLHVKSQNFSSGRSARSDFINYLRYCSGSMLLNISFFLF